MNRPHAARLFLPALACVAVGCVTVPKDPPTSNVADALPAPAAARPAAPPAPSPPDPSEPAVLPPGDVHDYARLFSARAVAAADTGLATMARRRGKHFVVETITSVPPEQHAAAVADRAGYFANLMVARAKVLDVNGVYLLICMDPKYVETAAGRQTAARGLFTHADVDRLRRLLIDRLTRSEYDAALSGAVDLVDRAFAANEAATNPATGPATAPG